ncbi:sugar transferase [uncultured Bacteroides sp.]|uniref:sugar transferase n=1 Tax=uncultured Bacteroides sp. TaxID=162156 RepID=UPI002AAC1C4D|nr:sugar transferase [uncultured Bacteroides sp.]
MKISQRKQLIKYLSGDYIAANVIWLLTNIYRYDYIASSLGFDNLASYLFSEKILAEQVFIPLFWLLLYYFSGYYNNPMKKSRLFELNKTLVSVEIGVLIVFFAIVINDLPRDYKVYYKLLGILFLGQFLFTYAIRALITQKLTKKIHNRKAGFSTLIVGAGERAQKLAAELDSQPQSLGYLITGFIDIGKDTCIIKDKPVGKWDDIGKIIREQGIEEIIVAPDSTNEKELFELLNGLYHYNLPIKAITLENSVLARKVKMSAIYGTPMIEVTRDNMSEGEKNIKKALDRIIAAGALILLSPLFAWIAWKIKKDSPGSIFYVQERLGYRGKPFSMIKFRTMKMDAENGNPQLSCENDSRVTNIGKILRKYRLDELPQFWNILKGEMSLVGPRPERKFYVDQVICKAPYFYQTLSVKPGITSWGMVKYGYANTVDKMIERLQYDLIYLENRSLGIDIKILIYTIRTILTGKGM